MKKTEFIKIGPGMVCLHDRQVIKQGQTFWAYWDDIPNAFAGDFEPVEPQCKEEFKEHQIITDKRPYYKLQFVGAGWYDVVDSEGKVLNEKRLRKTEAIELLDSLEEGSW